MTTRAKLELWSGASIFSALMGCAPTNVKMTSEYKGNLPKPNGILVYDFAVSPDEVKLDESVAAKLENAVQKTSRTEQERAIGRSMANALSVKLVEELQKNGLQARRAYGPTSARKRSLMIKGQFLSIDEGNQTERVVIGLGMGRTDVKTNVQVYQSQTGGPVLVEQFAGDAKSGYKPGMAESMGAGAVAGHVGAAAVASGVLAVGSEAFTANVEADAHRTAKELAKRIREIYMDRGWMPRI
ncbi:MAG: DUF4410 domain-containing protein [Planctomycetes bacterium]|nr:DUF4410 domain-containing protein [Planctomycetota bacterium]MBI3833969.1 DUF4410 domain-containing protein [Planctomycetota bacterium]